MKLRQIATAAAAILTLLGLAFGIGAPASAQGITLSYHQGWGHPHYWHHHHYYHPAVWAPGPGYVQHSWAWYQGRPAWWRHEHPYHRSGLSVWIHL